MDVLATVSITGTPKEKTTTYCSIVKPWHLGLAVKHHPCEAVKTQEKNETREESDRRRKRKRERGREKEEEEGKMRRKRKRRTSERQEREK